MFRSALEPLISQGDIFEGIEIAEKLGESESEYVGPVVLLSHDCEFDKPKVLHVLVARVQPRTGLDAGGWAAVVRGRTLNAIHLPAAGTLPERFVNLRYIHRVSKAVLVDASDGGQRSASMTHDGRYALVAYLYRFLTRSLPLEARLGIVGRVVVRILDFVGRQVVPRR